MSLIAPGVTSATLSPAFPQVVYYKQAILNWQFNTPFLEEACDWKALPTRSGRTQQFYGITPFTAATATLSEGVPGPSLELSPVISSTFADQYGDWIGVSDVAQSMFVQNPITDATRELSYRGALTSNLVAVNAFENAATTFATSRYDLGDNEFLISNTVRVIDAELTSFAVPVRDEGCYTAILSPLMVYDLFSDNSAGSMSDCFKRNDEGTSVLKGGQSRGYQVGMWSGVRLIRTPTVPTYANYPSSGKTGYAMYIVGREAMLATELMGQKVPRNPNFKVNVSFQDKADLSNPMLQTAAIVSYNWLLGVAPRPNTNSAMGFKRVRAEVSAA